jgi:hypothetical protein
MKRKGEALLAMKQFAKEIGVPDAFVADMCGEHMSKEVKVFCNEIGSKLRTLEEGTPWATKAELHIEGHEGSRLSNGVLGLLP